MNATTDEIRDAFDEAVKSGSIERVAKCMAARPDLASHAASVVCDMPYTRVTDAVLVCVFRYGNEEHVKAVIDAAVDYDRADILKKALAFARHKNTKLNLRDAFLNACRKCLTHIVRLLIDPALPPGHVNFDTYSCTKSVIQHNIYEAIDALIAKRVSVYTVFIAIAKWGTSEVVEIMRCLPKTETDIVEAIWASASLNNTVTLRVLLELYTHSVSGLVVHTVNRVLEQACRSVSLDAARVLVDAGATDFDSALYSLAVGYHEYKKEIHQECVELATLFVAHPNADTSLWFHLVQLDQTTMSLTTASVVDTACQLLRARRVWCNYKPAAVVIRAALERGLERCYVECFASARDVFRDLDAMRQRVAKELADNEVPAVLATLVVNYLP